MSSFVIHTLSILAQGATTTPASGKPQGLSDFISSPMLPILAVFLIFMIFSANSKRKTEKKRKSAMDSMKRGDRVQTIGGILGTVVDVREGEIVVKVDEGNNTKIRFSRSAIARMVEDEKPGETK